MAAHLYPGVKSLQLVLDRPYDAIRTTDVRDDLTSVKVWYSLTSGFNPNNGQGTLVPSGNSLNVTITGLTPNTRYYVKYAFISAIDEDEIDPPGPTGPGSYTVSSELSAVVLEENISVYGYLTNDPVPIVTATDGSGGDFSQATGVFKVFNLSTEVTGAGPVYGIKPFTTDNITGATINAVTGVYSCTGLTDDGGNVTFTATYNNVVIEQVWNVYRAKAGETAPLIQLSSPNKEFVYKDQFATSSQTPSTTVTARLVNLTGTPTFTVQAYTRDNVTTPLGNIAFTQNGNTITITKAQFDALGITIGTAKVTASIGTVSDVLTLYRINDGTEQITVELSNESHGIPAYADGTTTTSSYVGSGTLIQVKQGNTYLPVDNTSPYIDGSWRVNTINAVGIVCDTTPAVGGNFIEYNQHSTMDDALDVAYIDYTITGKTSSGVAFSIVKRQSFAKSKEGVQGATARSVAITAPGQAFVTAKNTNSPVPSTITLTAVQSNFITPQYLWQIQNPTTQAWEAPGSQGTATGSVFILNSFAPVGSKAVKVTVTENVDGETFSVFDIFSVYSLREGDDAFIIGLSNENQTISYDSGGDPNPGQFPVVSKLYAVLGTNFLTSSTNPAVTFAPVSYNGGGTYTIDGNGDITIQAPLTVDSATAVFSATIYPGTANAKTLTKSLTLNKSKDGKVGEGITQIYIRSTANPPTTPAASAGVPSGWSATVAGATGTDPLWTSFGKRAVGSTEYTWQTPVRVEGTTVINPPLKNATGYLYYNPPSPVASQPGKPQASGYDFATGEFSSITQYWSTTFTVVDNPAGKMWASRYSVQETVSGGAQTVETTPAFIHQNFNGIVTFTNIDTQVANTNTISTLSSTVSGKLSANDLSSTATITNLTNTVSGKISAADIGPTGTTVIDGGRITTGVVNANRLNIGNNSGNLNGDRIVIDGTATTGNNIKVYSAGNLRVVIGNLG
jgi:hypothetical protein